MDGVVDGPPREPIGVVGAGYVGLVTGACLASLGHRVIFRDIDESKLAMLEAGEAPIYEPGLEELLEANAPRLKFTRSMKELVGEASLVFVAVDTPSTITGDADLSRVRAVLDELSAAEASDEHLLVMKSTVPVGTGAKLRRELDARHLAHLGYVANPEFLREGAGIHDFLHPDRVVIGEFSAADGGRVAALYQSLDTPIVRTTVASAEMIKYASNAFLATKISFINEIANVCEEVGADVQVVAHGMGLDNRIGPRFLQAGIGYGGSCFPKDVAALKQLAGNSGYHFQLLSAVIEVNELQKRRVIRKLQRHLGTLGGKTVALLGLAFKPNTDDMREAASLVLAGRLLAEGALVRGYDPVVGVGSADLPRGINVCSSAESALEGADAAVLVTEWPALVSLDWSTLRGRMNHPLVVDGRNALPHDVLREQGFIVEAIGR